MSNIFDIHNSVKQFTEESINVTLPNSPQLMNRSEVEFITKMILDELIELNETLFIDEMNKIEKAKNNVLSILKNCNRPVLGLTDKTENTSDIEIIAEQQDALADIIYYIYNCAVKKGVNLTDIINVVHQANMNKKFPDGTFHRRDDGKVIKPEGWKEPDIEFEIQRQLSNNYIEECSQKVINMIQSQNFTNPKNVLDIVSEKFSDYRNLNEEEKKMGHDALDIVQQILQKAKKHYT